MKNSFSHAHNRFLDFYNKKPEVLSSAPGRINIIGEHTDYNLGFVLPACIDRNIQFLAKRRTDDRVSVWAEHFKESEHFFVHDLRVSKEKKWVNYVKGIFWVLEREGYSLGGLDAFIIGDIPIESGLSSSAALEVSVLNALNKLFYLSLSKEKIARLSRKAENDFVGVNCGLMDQFVSVFGKKNMALFLDCGTLIYEHVPLLLEEHGLNIVVYDSRVSRELSASEYNKRSLESGDALKILKISGVKNFKEADNDLLEDNRDKMGDILYRRARHVITENQRVIEAVRVLKERDFHKLGELLFESHLSLRDDYEVSCPELDLLYTVGKKFGGCLGARLTGAGFGGSGIALVEKAQTDAFINKLKRESKNHKFTVPVFHEVKIGEGAYVQ